MHQELTFIWSIACLVYISRELVLWNRSIRSKEIFQIYLTYHTFLLTAFKCSMEEFCCLIVSIVMEQPKLPDLNILECKWPILYLIFVGSIGGHGFITGFLSENKSCILIDVVRCIPVNRCHCSYLVLGVRFNLHGIGSRRIHW